MTFPPLNMIYGSGQKVAPANLKILDYHFQGLGSFVMLHVTHPHSVTHSYFLIILNRNKNVKINVTTMNAAQICKLAIVKLITLSIGLHLTDTLPLSIFGNFQKYGKGSPKCLLVINYLVTILKFCQLLTT